MKAVRFHTCVLDLDDQPVLDTAGKNVTLGSAIRMALLANDAQMDPERKLACFDLAVKTRGKDYVELTADEVALIRERVGVGYGPLIVGRVKEALD